MTTTQVKTSTLEKDLDKKMQEIDDARIEDGAKGIAQSSGLKYLDLRFFPVDTKALFLIDEPSARGAQLAVIAKNNTALTIAVLDPHAVATQTLVQDLTTKGYTISMVIASVHGLNQVWGRYKLRHEGNGLFAGITAINESEIESLQSQINDIGDLKGKVHSLPITKVLDILLAGALKVGASDIHFEPEETTIRLRYRLDGVLTDIVTFSRDGYHDILSRIKLTSGLKINIHSAPQDGRFTIRLQDKDIEVRVSILPGAYGENIVMRILDPSSIRQKLEDLGMREDLLVLIKKLLMKTTGTILTTGPTGSGKTTTLYAFVQYMNTPDIKIITIEDPIEYHITGISQTQVNEHAGYTFVDGLRSIVRQDPDVILVGEIRDKETAEIAMQAALTGHLVLSTIHTNNAAGTIPRLIDLGVRPVTIAPAINAAMAQRLIRKLCVSCKKKEKVHPEDFELIHKYLAKLPTSVSAPLFDNQTEIYYPVGCIECNSTGFKGRIGVYEIFEVDADMQKLILKSPALAEVEEMAVEKGLTTLIQDALIKVVGGLTSTDEVLRVIGE